MKNKLQNEKGFTLIEMIIYIGIFSMLIGTILIFLNTISSSRINNQILLEVNNQGSSVVRIITSNIQNGISINNPNMTMGADTLSIETADTNTNPTIFSTINGVLYIKKGTDEEIALTNNKVQISNLIFTNLSRPDTLGVVQIYFKLNGLDHNNIIYSSDFYGSSSIRK